MNVCYIAARAPTPGAVKTRLGAVIGNAPAATLYGAFLKDLARNFQGASFTLRWYVTPKGGWHAISSVIGQADAGRLIQRGRDWRERQRNLFAGAARRGEDATVLIASDSPQLSPAIVEDAFAALRTHDLVLGATHDGGYYLIGMRAFHDVLAGVTMTTGTVLQEVLANARRLELSVAQLTPAFDVDDTADLPALRRATRTRPDLPATRAALSHLGLMAPTGMRS